MQKNKFCTICTSLAKKFNFTFIELDHTICIIPMAKFFLLPFITMTTSGSISMLMQKYYFYTCTTYYKNLCYWFSAQDDIYDPSNNLIPNIIHGQGFQNNDYVGNNMYVNIEI